MYDHVKIVAIKILSQRGPAGIETKSVELFLPQLEDTAHVTTTPVSASRQTVCRWSLIQYENLLLQSDI